LPDYSTSVTISWSGSVGSDSGSGLQKYEVLRSTDAVAYTSQTNTSQTSWADSTATTTAQTYFYKVRTYDNVNNTATSSQVVWTTIDRQGPTVTVNFPGAGASYAIGGTITINATISDSGSGLSTNPVCSVSVGTITIGSFYSPSSSYCLGNVTVPSISIGTYDLNVTVSDRVGNSGSGNRTITITAVDTTAPNSPALVTLTQVGSTREINISWTASTSSDVVRYNVYYKLNGAVTTSDNSQSVGNVTRTSVVVGQDGNWNFTVTAVDSSSNEGSIAPASNITINTNTTGSIDGYILMNGTDTVVSGAIVSDDTRAAVTNANGYYVISGVPAGTYTLTVSATSYVTNSSATAIVTVGATTRANISLQYNATGIIQGYVLQNGTSTVISGATVSDGTRAAVSNSVGFYQITGVPVGTYTLTAMATNYITNSSAGSVTVTTGSTNNANISIANNATGIIQGYAYLTNTTLRPNATVQVSDVIRTANTNSAGFYQITGVPAGTYTLTVSGVGYWANTTASVAVLAGSTTTQNMWTTGAENFNVTIPGTVGSSTTGFYDSGWHQFFLSIQVFSGATTNYTIANLFTSVESKYTILYRYNSTAGSWTSYVPGAGSNDLTSIGSTSDQYYINMNATDRVEIERRY
jgi:hypothetical protein